jgi:hypothetical protein
MFTIEMLFFDMLHDCIERGSSVSILSDYGLDDWFSPQQR